MIHISMQDGQVLVGSVEATPDIWSTNFSCTQLIRRNTIIIKVCEPPTLSYDPCPVPVGHHFSPASFGHTLIVLQTAAWTPSAPTLAGCRTGITPPTVSHRTDYCSPTRYTLPGIRHSLGTTWLVPFSLWTVGIALQLSRVVLKNDLFLRSPQCEFPLQRDVRLRRSSEHTGS